MWGIRKLNRNNDSENENKRGEEKEGERKRCFTDRINKKFWLTSVVWGRVRILKITHEFMNLGDMENVNKCRKSEGNYSKPTFDYVEF